MIVNKIISVIISIIAIVIIPIQAVTTFVFGILVSLTFGLLLVPFSIVWMILFLGPLLGLSYVYEKVPVSRPVVGLLGIPLAVIADIYVGLIPSMGEMDSRFAKMIYCQTFPYTWTFHLFYTKKSSIEDKDVFNKILEEVSGAKPLGIFIENLKSRDENPS